MWPEAVDQEASKHLTFDIPSEPLAGQRLVLVEPLDNMQIQEPSPNLTKASNLNKDDTVAN